ncbi:MAG TPA: amidase [Chloroflexia bacterium]|nr:amidase [Chloroflexia bacterium]
MTGFSEYTEYDGLGLAELIRNGQVSPAELLEAAIAQIDSLNPTINSVIYKMYEQARKTIQQELPEGPFRGVPFLLKDLMAVHAGVPYTAGSRFMRDFVPGFDSELVKRYKQAGLVIVGKTNTPEFGLVPFTEPELHGPTRNPWDTSRTVGGSSGGSGAAVAARFVPIANGGDGGGSLRVPASCCGVFGFKPTRGRIPTGPHMGEVWQGFVTEHVLSRTVRDSAAMLDATAGPDTGAPYITPDHSRSFLEEVQTRPGKLRIAFSTKPFWGKSMHPDCVEAVKSTAELLQDLGHEVVEDTPPMNAEEMAYNFVIMLCGEVYGDLTEISQLMNKKLSRAEFEPATWALYLTGKALSAGEFSLAVRKLQVGAREVARFFEKYDILLTPTLSQPPFKIGTLQQSEMETRFLKAIGFMRAGKLLLALNLLKTLSSSVFEFIPDLPIFNVTGQPAMSVPLYWNKENLPVGVQLVGRFADDASLFRLAGQLEEARPWNDKRPPLLLNKIKEEVR